MKCVHGNAQITRFQQRNNSPLSFPPLPASRFSGACGFASDCGFAEAAAGGGVGCVSGELVSAARLRAKQSFRLIFGFLDFVVVVERKFSAAAAAG